MGAAARLSARRPGGDQREQQDETEDLPDHQPSIQLAVYSVRPSGCFDVRFVEHPAPGQPGLAGRQLKVAQGDTQVHPLQVGHDKAPVYSPEIARGPLQVEMPGAAVSDDAPRLLVRGRGSQAHHLQRPGVGARRFGRQREAKLPVKEQPRPAEPAVRACLPADEPVHQATPLGDVAHGSDAGHHFPLAQAHLGGETTLAKGATQPAGAEIQGGGIEDGILHPVAEILQLLDSAAHRTQDKAGSAPDKTIGAQPPQGAPVVFARGDELEAGWRTKRSALDLGQKCLQVPPLFSRDGSVQVGPARKALLDYFRDRFAVAHGPPFSACDAQIIHHLHGPAKPPSAESSKP